MAAQGLQITPGDTLQHVDAHGSAALTQVERWLALGGGGALALLGLVSIGRRPIRSLALLAGGGALLAHGLTSTTPLLETLGVGPDAAYRALGQATGPAMQFSKSVTVARSAAEVYDYWHHFENLPRFMRHLDRVTDLGGGRSHWVARIPANTTVEWDAELLEDRPQQLISWRSLPSARVANQGAVQFLPAPGARGTEVHVTIRYVLPGGMLGKAVARLTNVLPSQQVKDDVLRFKEVLEAGEIASTEGQPDGR